MPVLLSTIEAFSHLRMYMPKDVRSLSARETIWKGIQEVKKRYEDKIPHLDPVVNMQITDESFKTLVNVRLVSLPCSYLMD